MIVRLIAYVQHRDIKHGMPLSRAESHVREQREFLAGLIVVAMIVIVFAIVGGEDLRVATAQAGPKPTVAEAATRSANGQRTALADADCRPLHARKAHSAAQIANQCTTTERAAP